MKNPTIIFAACFVLVLFTYAGLFAQQGIVASGNNASGSGGSVSYSVGQPDYKAATGNNGYLIQGLQQPFEISEVSGMDIKEIQLLATVYPNPSRDAVTLKISNYDFSMLSFLVYDGQGRTVINKKIEGSETLVELTGQADALYFLKVLKQNEEIKSFKIIKQY